MCSTSRTADSSLRYSNNRNWSYVGFVLHVTPAACRPDLTENALANCRTGRAKRLSRNASISSSSSIRTLWAISTVAGSGICPARHAGKVNMRRSTNHSRKEGLQRWRSSSTDISSQRRPSLVHPCSRPWNHTVATVEARRRISSLPISSTGHRPTAPRDCTSRLSWTSLPELSRDFPLMKTPLTLSIQVRLTLCECLPLPSLLSGSSLT